MAEPGVSGATIGGGGSGTSNCGESGTESCSNRAQGSYSTICGGLNNTVSADYATVAGGVWNTAGHGAGVGGGDWNTASGDFAAIGGGDQNTASGVRSTIGGGLANLASGMDAIIGGGANNQASGLQATVSGGGSNAASQTGAFVGGGIGNSANGQAATVGGGGNNQVSGDYATVGGGGNNQAGGFRATVSGGDGNVANGDFSFAAGRYTKANHPGAFVWADATNTDFASTADNQFAVRASGGVTFSTGSAPVQVNGNPVWHAGNDGSGSGLDADLLDGEHADAFQRHHQNMVVVAKSGGDYTSIQAALDAITDASEINGYLVWVAPGVYIEQVTMKPYVDIEGAGELTTVVSYGGSYAPFTGTLVGADNAELRFLTVKNTGDDEVGGGSIADRDL